MDLDQITFPPENEPYKQRFDGDGFLWFLETSWRYVNPIGFKATIKFFADFPNAYIRYRKMMACEE